MGKIIHFLNEIHTPSAKKCPQHPRASLALSQELFSAASLGTEAITFGQNARPVNHACPSESSTQTTDQLITLLEHRVLCIFHHHTWLGRVVINISQMEIGVGRLNGLSKGTEWSWGSELGRETLQCGFPLLIEMQTAQPVFESQAGLSPFQCKRLN